MVKKRRIRNRPIGIVNEERIHTDGGLVAITNSHLGEAVYELKIAFEDGEIIETFGEMTHGRAWILYFEQCEHYRNGGVNPVNEVNPILSEDFEEGLPDYILNRLYY